VAGVKYRGLDPRTRPLRWGLFLLVVGGVLFLTLPGATATVAGWFGAGAESLPWYATRALGFLGFWALTASVVYGLLLSTGILDALSHRAVSLTLHQDLSAIGIALVALHGAVLVLDTFVQTTVFQIAVPFATEYRPVWVGIGQIAFYVMVVVYASFFFRKRLGQRGWRMLHYTTFLAFIGGAAHGLMAGTDTSAPWALWSYAGSIALVVFLLIYRIAVSVARGSSRVASTAAERR
jgi:methionine sulfoxide reductase heme-binding subunit